jgi:hypothetical protein
MPDSIEKPSQKTQDFQDYKAAFVQHEPRFAVKKVDGNWTLVKSAITDNLLDHHLSGNLVVAALARWYPSHLLIDIDHAESFAEVDEIREALGFTESNSLLFESQTPGHYHILARPTYRGVPCTARIISLALADAAKQYGFEVYPQRIKPARLPFSPTTTPLFNVSNRWTDLLYWFQKLDDYELKGLKLPKVKVEPLSVGESWSEMGRDFLVNGLRAAGTRNLVQRAALYCLWRDNWGAELACARVFRLLLESREMSKDMQRNPLGVRRELKRAADHIWAYFDSSKIFPDHVQKHYQHLTSLAAAQAVMWSGGTVRGLRFALDLVAYLLPRACRGSVSVHRDLLRQWSSKYGYLEAVGSFCQLSGAERGCSYEVAGFAKKIAIPPTLHTTGRLVLRYERPVMGLQILKHVPEAGPLLLQSGFSSDMKNRILSLVNEPGSPHIYS